MLQLLNLIQIKLKRELEKIILVEVPTQITVNLDRFLFTYLKDLVLEGENK